jgi:signal transduction histidine kinase
MRHIAELLATDRVASEDRRQRSYALLVNETDRLGHLVEELLDFRRLQDGQLTLQFECRRPGGLVREVVTDFQRRLDASTHEVDVRIDDGLPAVRVDRDAFRRALWNLLDNAVKYSPTPASVGVHVGAEPATGRVVVTVRDAGPGIPADEQTLIFDRFVRGADAKARRIKGTGIGLAMAREIARAHGGDLTVASTPGAGSAFTIALPPAET